MRRAYKVWSGIAAGVFSLVAVTDLASAPAPASTTSTTAAATPSSWPVAAPAPAPVADVTTDTTTSTVLRVIDGDTFRTADGLDVRVLGIDSCEAATPGGRRATDAARGLLLGSDVTLTAEPGVDRDRYGRALRYVTTNGRDYGETMVTADHTALYTRGHNDASPARQATLRGLDAGGRSCGDPAPVTSAPARRAVVPDVDRPRTRRPAPVAAPAPAPARPAAASYKNCAAAKAAGAAPLHVGEPGYAPKLDRDGDGVACER